ncbi:MAG: restriction endonuclease subunit S [Veillonella sp.]|nr:restriction endonuclease subunit S [Veillonella sp.]
MAKNNKRPAIRFSGYTDDWEQRKLGECMSSFAYGLNAAAKEYDGMHKYIRITDIDDETHNFIQSNLTSPDIDFNMDVSDYKLNVGDIVFARTGASVGKTYLYNPNDGDLYYAGFLIRGKVKEDCDAGFIYQNTLTKDYDSFIKITSQRSGQPGVNSKEYATFRLNIPCKDEQEKISKVLNSLDELFTLHQRKLEKLKLTKKALLQKLFPKNGSKFPELRLKGFADDWEQRKLGSIGSTYTGLSGKTKEDFGHGEAQYITYLNVFQNTVSDIAMTDKVEIDISQNEVKYGDVLFTTSSETPEEVGMSSVWLGYTPNIYLNSFCFGFRPNQKIDPYFLGYSLRAPYMRDKIKILAQGISRYNISKNKVMELEISLPNNEEQSLLGNFLRNIDLGITLHQRKLEMLKNIKKGLLQKMFV